MKTQHDNLIKAYHDFTHWEHERPKQSEPLKVPFVLFAEMLLINPEYYNEWNTGFYRKTVLKILKMHYEGFFVAYVFPWKVKG